MTCYLFFHLLFKVKNHHYWSDFSDEESSDDNDLPKAQLNSKPPTKSSILASAIVLDREEADDEMEPSSIVIVQKKPRSRKPLDRTKPKKKQRKNSLKEKGNALVPSLVNNEDSSDSDFVKKIIQKHTNFDEPSVTPIRLRKARKNASAADQSIYEIAKSSEKGKKLKPTTKSVNSSDKGKNQKAATNYMKFSATKSRITSLPSSSSASAKPICAPEVGVKELDILISNPSLKRKKTKDASDEHVATKRMLTDKSIIHSIPQTPATPDLENSRKPGSFSSKFTRRLMTSTPKVPQSTIESSLSIKESFIPENSSDESLNEWMNSYLAKTQEEVSRLQAGATESLQKLEERQRSRSRKQSTSRSRLSSKTIDTSIPADKKVTF